MLRHLRLAALAVASLLTCAAPAFAQTATGVPTLGSDSSTYTWCAQTITTGKLGGCTVKYTWNGTSWVVEPTDSSGRPLVSLTAPVGSYAAGAFAAGTGVDGWDLTEGSKSDSAYSGSGSASIVSLLKGIYSSAIGSIPVGSNVIGAVTQSGGPWTVAGQASSTGGASAALQGALTTTVQSIKSSAGQLYNVLCYNPNSSVAYVQIFNVAAGSVTLGTTAAAMSIPIPAASNGGFSLSPVGVGFPTAISWAATTTYNGSTANSSAVSCDAVYQ